MCVQATLFPTHDPDYLSHSTASLPYAFVGHFASTKAAPLARAVTPARARPKPVPAHTSALQISSRDGVKQIQEAQQRRPGVASSARPGTAVTNPRTGGEASTNSDVLANFFDSLLADKKGKRVGVR